MKRRIYRNNTQHQLQMCGKQKCFLILNRFHNKKSKNVYERLIEMLLKKTNIFDLLLINLLQQFVL